MSKKTIALSQVGILIVALFAFSFIIGGAKLVEADKIVMPPLQSISPQGLDIGNLELAQVPLAQEPSGFSNVLFSLTHANIVVILKSLGIGIAAGAVAFLVGKLVGFNTRNALALGGSVAAGTSTTTFLITAASLGPIAWAVGGVIGIVMFLSMFKLSSADVITFNCNAWQAPDGGDYCGLCNDEEFGCTEYQCKSLGRACELINQGTEEQMCIWKDRNDVTPPVIEPWTEILSDGHSYTPIDAISPPDRGVEIIKDGSEQCLEPYTPITLGIQTFKDNEDSEKEAAICKVSTSRTDNYDDMPDVFMGSSLSKFDHGYQLLVPSQSDAEAMGIILNDDGVYEFYVRCKDENGNSNVGEFVFRYCVQEGPDATAPLIIATDPQDESPVGYEQQSISTIVYVNEPATCKWDIQNRAYDDMGYDLDCSGADSIEDINIHGTYTCVANLEGIKNRQDNNFYFRCKDQPWYAGINESLRNAMQSSYSLTLVGTEPLVITDIGPEGIMKDSVDVIKITLTAETTAGYDDGRAVCMYSESCYDPEGSQESYSEFYYAGERYSEYSHSQEVYATAGDYNCSIKCQDLAGNTDTAYTLYTIETDTQEPTVVRAYYESNKLKIITDEEAECVYSDSNTGCNYAFDDGLQMTTMSDGITHYLEWDTNEDFYIKCRDQYGNQPTPQTTCSIVVKPFEDYA